MHSIIKKYNIPIYYKTHTEFEYKYARGSNKDDFEEIGFDEENGEEVNVTVR